MLVSRPFSRRLSGFLWGAASCPGPSTGELSPAERASHLAWLPQRGSLVEPIPVLERVASARYRFDETRTQALDAAAISLSEVGVSHLADRLWIPSQAESFSVSPWLPCLLNKRHSGC